MPGEVVVVAIDTWSDLLLTRDDEDPIPGITNIAVPAWLAAREAEYV